MKINDIVMIVTDNPLGCEGVSYTRGNIGIINATETDPIVYDKVIYKVVDYCGNSYWYYAEELRLATEMDIRQGFQFMISIYCN